MAMNDTAMDNPIVPDLADDDDFTGLYRLNQIHCRIQSAGLSIRPGDCEKAISMIPSPHLHPKTTSWAPTRAHLPNSPSTTTL